MLTGSILLVIVSLLAGGIDLQPAPATGYGSTLSPLAWPLDLYVDSVNGNDANPCTQANPCRTITRAQRFIPYVIDNDVTIYLSAGTYTEYIVFGNVDRDRGDHVHTISLIGQSWSLFTPTTGVSSGTFSSGSGRVVTLAGAGWTPGDLATRFVHITSGTQQGRYFPIADNTATTITLPVPGMVMTAIQHATFDLRTPAAILAPEVSATNDFVVSTTGTAKVHVETLDLNPSGQSFAALGYRSVSKGSMTQCRIHGSVYVIHGDSGSEVEANNSSFFVPAAQLGISGSTMSLSFSAIVGEEDSSTGVIWDRSLLTDNVILNTQYYAFLVPENAPAVVANFTNTDTIGQVDVFLKAADGGGVLTVAVNQGNIQVTSQGIAPGVTGVIYAAFDGGVVLASLGDGVTFSTPHNALSLGAATITAAGWGVNLAYDSGTDIGAMNNLRLGASSVLTGTNGDITLDGSTPLSLTTLRATPGTVLVDANNLNRAISY